MASVKLMATVVLMFTPSRTNSGSARTLMKTYRSPSGPPRRPALPCATRRTIRGINGCTMDAQECVTRCSCSVAGSTVRDTVRDE
eukprot:2515901-Pyramimonas_sp.AAC.1